jgi:toxin ETX/toxin MTX2
MEGLVADDGNLYLRQNNKTIWDNGFHDALLESVVSDLKYDVKNIRRMPTGDPIRIEIPGAPNNTDTPQTTTLTLKHTQSTTHMWTDKIGTTLGVKATSSIDVPFVGSASVEVSASVTNEFTWGKSYSDTKEIDASVALTVPPHKKYKAWMEVQEMDYELPFTTTGTFRFKSGKQVTRTISGIYKGVSGDRGQVGWDDITDARNPKNVFTANKAEADRLLAAGRA